MLRALANDQSGNVAILFGVAASLGVFLGAFAIDEASLYLEKRELQAAVDLAAIEAAREPAQAAPIVLSTLKRAGLVAEDLDLNALNASGSMHLTVQVGRYTADASIAPAERFVPSATPYNAVRTTFQRTGRRFFSSWMDAPTVGVQATAAVTPEVMFSVGSRLASLEGGVANAALNRLLGMSVGLSVADYNALASADVGVFAFADALANRIGISAGTYDRLLTTNVAHGDIAAALASMLNGLPSAAAQVVASTTSFTDRFPVSRLLGLGRLAGLTMGNGAALSATVSALELLVASATLGDGDNQVTLNLSSTIPSLSGITLHLAIGEPPQSGHWFAVGRDGTVARTAQIRLRLRINLLGGPILLGAGVSVPLGVDLAYAEARVASASCPTSSSPRGNAVIAARPGIARVFIGDAPNHNWLDLPSAVERSRLLDALLLKVDARAVADVGEVAPVYLSFSSSDIDAGIIKKASTTTIVESLSSSLISGAQIDVQILGIGIGTRDTIAAAVRALILPIAPVLDGIIADVLKIAGLALGQADVRVHRVMCPNAVLVG